jgi:hypothetical protein
VLHYLVKCEVGIWWDVVCVGSQHLKIRHILDVMHCEKNLCENIVRTLMGENNYPRAREDMRDMGIREELWLRSTENNPGHYTVPHLTYVLTPMEKQKVLELIAALRTPTDYAGSVQAHVCDGRLRFMKSHDYHVLMQQVRSGGSLLRYSNFRIVYF